jgi:hypothetical protein
VSVVTRAAIDSHTCAHTYYPSSVRRHSGIGQAAATNAQLQRGQLEGGGATGRASSMAGPKSAMEGMTKVGRRLWPSRSFSTCPTRW